MKQAIIEQLRAVAAQLGISPDLAVLEYPENPEHGDFSTNMALAAAKSLKMPPKALAEKIMAAFVAGQPGALSSLVESVSIAGPGFINFKVKDAAFMNEIFAAPKKASAEVSKKTASGGRQVMVEYTDPNPFKVFHIGHLMSNAIGESLSRLIEYSGADVIRACYQGDVGLHVAKALWGALHIQEPKSDFASSSAFWGTAYALGSKAYDEDEKAKQEIADINKKVYDRSDPEINTLYDVGRQSCLDDFEKIYALLGTSFRNYFFESQVAPLGVSLVKEAVTRGIFAESEGAIVFKGEEHGLHTRVFITSAGLPTYETKELGLNTEKFKLYPDLVGSIIVTANEVNEYFKVVLKAFSLVNKPVADKTTHVSHGIMRLQSGKMSSRTGNVVTAEALIGQIRDLVKEKMAGREFSAEVADSVSDTIAIGAIKYSILRQAIGGDVIFDSAQSISFEGDSGPYLQYSAVRAHSLLEKAAAEKISDAVSAAVSVHPERAGTLERLLARFPDIADRARQEYAPQLIASYLIALAGAFNGFYATTTIIDAKDPLSPYRVALTAKFLATMTDGLWLLGIKVPERM